MDELLKNVQMGSINDLFSKCGHICLIYDNEEQRKKVVSEYMAVGLKQGEQVRYFADVVTYEDVYSWLLEIGVELREPNEKGYFGLTDATNAYCPTGRFEPQKMIDGSAHRYELAKKAGFTGVRSCGEMTWALKGVEGSNRFLEYEALLNTVTETFPHSGMCQYDARVFDGATLFKVLQVHPFMIAQGQVVNNPFYLKPEEFLANLKIGK